MVRKSLPINQKVGRGCVAVYNKQTSDINHQVFCHICPETVVFSIEDTDTLFIAPYFIKIRKYLPLLTTS